VLSLAVEGRPDVVPSPQAVGPDGRIGLGRLGRFRVEGLTVGEITHCLAGVLGVHPQQIQVQVIEYNSQKVYLFGTGSEVERAVAYRGPEKVLTLLQRSGGIKPGAAPDEVFVVRSRIPDGGQPEVFHIRLADIVLKKEEKTNIALQPFDQVFIGETRQSCLQECIPPCLRPLYKSLCGLQRPRKPPPPPDGSGTDKRRKKFIFRLPLPKHKDTKEPEKKPEIQEAPPTYLPPPRRVALAGYSAT
jgi:hypothetical protein